LEAAPYFIIGLPASYQTKEQKDCCAGMMGKNMGNMTGMMGMWREPGRWTGLKYSSAFLFLFLLGLKGD